MPQLTYNSPIGPLTITEEDGAVVSLDWGWPPEVSATALLDRACTQLDEYFSGRRQTFDLPLAPAGTAFQRGVWGALSEIPFGCTRSYGDIARQLATAPRAVGGACGRNPIPILVPCHRVLTGTGSIGGYSGMDGPDTKVFLLRHEGVTLSITKESSL